MTSNDMSSEFSRGFYFQYNDFKDSFKGKSFDEMHDSAKTNHDDWFTNSYNPTVERTIKVAMSLMMAGAFSLVISAITGAASIGARLVGYNLSRLTVVSLTTLKVGALLTVVGLVVNLAAYHFNWEYLKIKTASTTEFLFLNAIKKGNISDSRKYLDTMSRWTGLNLASSYYSDLLGLMTLNHKMLAIKKLFFMNAVFHKDTWKDEKHKCVNAALFKEDDTELSYSFLEQHPKIAEFYKVWPKCSFSNAEKINDFKKAFDSENQFYSAGSKIWTATGKDPILSNDAFVDFGEYFLTKNFGHKNLQWNQTAFDDYKKTL